MNLYKQIKSAIPAWIKYPLWYVFKAPQRRLSPRSLITDLEGISVWLWHKVFPKKKLQPVSICTGLYNRSENYLKQFLSSINQTSHRHLIELSVFDCGSDDIPDIEAAIRSIWKGSFVFSSKKMPFSRSAAFNKAVAQSRAPIIFICDADMSVPENIVQLCNNYTGHKRVWYPIVYFLFKNKPAKVGKGNGEWAQYSAKGMLACTRKDFDRIGGLDESFKTWGAEDNELWERFYKQRFTVIVNRQHGMMHHWHTTHNRKYAHLN